MTSRKKIWIVDDMYCYHSDNNELSFVITDYQSSTIREATTLSKGSVCKLIKLLAEHLVDVPDNMWGPADGPNIGYFNVAAVDTKLKYE